MPPPISSPVCGRLAPPSRPRVQTALLAAALMRQAPAGSGERGNVLTVGTYFYVAVCRRGGFGVARRFGAHRRREAGHNVAAARLQLATEVLHTISWYFLKVSKQIYLVGRRFKLTIHQNATNSYFLLTFCVLINF